MTKRDRFRVRTAALATGVAGVACAACAVFYGCALGLDPSKIGAFGQDSSLPPPTDASSQDATASGTPDAGPAEAEAGPTTCALNTDCVSTNACLVGACDASVCSFAVCPTAAACQGSSCVAATSTCSAPTTYGFHASEVNVTAGPVGCGGSAAWCIAAAAPFVFVGTTNGVVAYPENDPSNPSPTAIPVTGLPFLPMFLTAMGSRVYFVGTPQGTGPTYRLAIASLDVPNNPLVTTLKATSVFQVVSISSLAAAWAAMDGSLFLSNNDPAQLLPAANVMPPFTDGATIISFTSPGVPSGATAVIPSGSRLVMQHWQAAPTPSQSYFSFETGAGSASAQNSGDQPTAPTIGSTGQQSTYAQGSDGSVVWNAATTFVDDAGGNDFASVRVAWLVANGSSTQLAPTKFVDVEPYPTLVPVGNQVVGPVAWIDSTTALVLAAAAGTITGTSAGQTSVQVAVSAPTPALASGRRFIVPQAVGQVGAAASGGLGYVLAAGVAGTPSCTLHVFAPSCAGGP